MTYAQEVATQSRLADLYRECRTLNALLTETAVRIAAIEARLHVAPQALDDADMALTGNLATAQNAVHALNIKLAELAVDGQARKAG